MPVHFSDTPSRPALRASACLLVVAALAAATILPAPYATLWPDTVRDLSSSLELARGESLPLAGPPINFGPRMGPIFIWLQAIVLALVPSMAAASVAIAVAASLKFPFLYGFGRVVGGDLLGLSFALAAAFPTISAYNWIVFFHPNLVEAGIAAAMLLGALAWQRRSIALYYAATAVLGFAVQMHPTALFYLPMAALVLLGMNVHGRRMAVHLGGAVAMVAIWFLPLLFVEAGPNQSGLARGLGRIVVGLQAFTPSDVLTVLRTAYFDIPLAVGDTYAAFAGMPPSVWRWLLALVALGCATGVACAFEKGREASAILATLAVVLLAGWTCATAVRTYTSFWLCFFLMPLSAITLGTVLHCAASSARAPARLLGFAAMGALLVCGLVAGVGARALGAQASIDSRLPLLADLRHPYEASARATLIGASARDAFAGHVCARAGRVTLHGEFAYALAASTGLDYRLHCPGRAADVRILGSGECSSAITGIAASAATALGKAPLATFDGLAGFRVTRSLHPAEGRSIERDWHHFEELRDRRPETAVVLDFATAPGEAVTVYRLKPFHSSWRNFKVTRAGVAAIPVFSTYNSDTYVSGGASARWRIEFETDAPQWVDVHAF